MGTIIRLLAYRDDDKTTPEQWSLMVELFENKYGDVEIEDYMVEAPVVRCSYSLAEINMQFSEEELEPFKGSGISLELTYLERDPDEVIEL